MERYREMLTQFKRFIITEELKKYDYNVCATSRSFGMHRNSLNRLIEELGINLDAGRGARKTAKKRVNGSTEGIISTVESDTGGSISKPEGIAS